MDERTALIGLTLVPYIAPLTVKRLLEAYGSGFGVWRATEAQLYAVEGVPASTVKTLLAARDSIERQVEQTLQQAQRYDARLITLADTDYPARLKTIYDPPAALYVRGTLAPSDDLAIAIVGARFPSAYGIETAERFGRELAERGIAVVSGMARGIDGAAHRGALAAGGRTIAILGSGLARLYPPEHRELADQIAASGAVISEFSLAMRPAKTHFPRRNRLISGLALGVLVVEAGEKSGALITASAAAEQGREIFAIPGKISSPTSVGTHALLKDGARLVTDIDDILTELRLVPARMPTAVRAAVPAVADATAQEQCLLRHLSDEPIYLDDLADATGLSPTELSSLILRLELTHRIRQWPGQRYTVCSQ